MLSNPNLRMTYITVVCLYLSLDYFCSSFTLYSWHRHLSVPSLHETFLNGKVYFDDDSKPLKPDFNPNIKRQAISGKPEVARSVPRNLRVPLSALKVGDKKKGQVISITDFGLYVDVGSYRDGLLHVKDISDKYFIPKLESRFTPGQEIECYVKYVSEDKGKLGLQMIPVEEAKGDVLPLNSLEIGQPVSGIVEKVSNFGVYIDIGVGCLAFLHKRKMLIPRKQRQNTVWELLPMKSKVEAYVYSVDLERSRVELTGYNPEEWDVKLPPRGEKSTHFRGDHEDDDEGMGGTTRAENYRALQRTLGMTIDEEGDEEGEDLDVSQFNRNGANENQSPSAGAVAAGGQGGRDIQVLMDDFGGQTGKSNAFSPSRESSRNVKSKAVPTDDDSEESSVEELFEELRNGKSHVTIKDVASWEYVEQLMRNGDVDEGGLRDLCTAAGAAQGKMNLAALNNFVNLMNDELEMEIVDENGNPVDPGAMTFSDESSSEEAMLVMDDFSAAPAKSSKAAVGKGKDKGDVLPVVPPVVSQVESGLLDIEDIGQEEDDRQFGMGQGRSGPVVFNPALEHASADSVSSGGSDSSLNLEELHGKRDVTGPLLQFMFSSVSGKKKYVTLEDVFKWDLCIAVMKQVGLDRSKVQDMFNRSGPRKGVLDLKAFEKLLDQLTQSEAALDSGKAKSASTSGSGFKEKAVSSTKLSVQSNAVVASADSTKDDDDDGDEEEEEDEEDWEEIDLEEAFTTLSKKRGFVTVDELADWVVVRELIEQEELTLPDLKEICSQAGAKRGRLDYDAFEAALDLMSPLADEDNYPDEDEDEEWVGGVNNDKKVVTTTISAVELEGGDEEGAEGTADEDDQELLVDVFKGLAGDKDKASYKDLLNWDFVVDLLADGKLSEVGLKEMMVNAGGTEKGVTLDSFDKLMDELVLLHKEMEEDDEDEDDEDDELIEGEDGEYVDVDVEEAFNEISNGKSYFTMKDLKEWVLFLRMKRMGMITDEMLDEIVKKSGVTSKRMDSLDLEAIFDELQSEEDEDGDVDG